MENRTNQKKDFAAIITEGLEIKRKGFEPDHTHRLLSDLFRDSPGQSVSVPLILETIDELKAATVQEPDVDAANARTKLVGDFYQIAVAQTIGDARDDLTRDLTFFYLAAGLNEEFIHWSDVLLTTMQKNSIEYRATLFAIGAAQIFINQSDKAKDSFNRLLKDYPDAAEAYFGLALAYLKLGDRSHFENALEFTRRRAPELGRIIDRLSNKNGFSMHDYILEMSLLDERNNG